MIRTFKYSLYPNKAQEKILNNWLEMCCELYNAALYERLDAWKKQKRSMTLYEQQKELTEIRASDEEWKRVSVYAERSTLKRLDEAFKSFFDRVKRGSDKPGFPRYKSKSRYNSFSISKRFPKNDKIRIMGIGIIKFYKYRNLRGEVLDVIIRRKCNRWYICFLCDVGQRPNKVTEIKSSAGLDLGINKFIFLSNGFSIDRPEFIKKSEEIIRRRQQKLSKKIKNSKSWHKAKTLVEKAYSKFYNQKLDYFRKLAKDLFVKYDLLAIEDLDICKMFGESRSLNRNITSASWGMFINTLTYKAEEAGKYLVLVDPRNTSSRCCKCGKIEKKELTERKHRCKNCDLELDRDHNAALNILALGRNAVKPEMVCQSFVEEALPAASHDHKK